MLDISIGVPEQNIKFYKEIISILFPLYVALSIVFLVLVNDS